LVDLLEEAGKDKDMAAGFVLKYVEGQNSVCRTDKIPLNSHNRFHQSWCGTSPSGPRTQSNAALSSRLNARLHLDWHLFKSLLDWAPEAAETASIHGEMAAVLSGDNGTFQAFPSPLRIADQTTRITVLVGKLTASHLAKKLLSL